MSDPKPITAVGVSRTIVGLNYAWAFNKYGLYFGPHPKEPWMDDWIECFDDNLQMMKEQLGVRLVRIFLLCNGQNLGQIDGSGKWMFKPARDPAYPIFLEHLKKMFEVLRKNQFKVIPSLIDFRIGAPEFRKEERYRIVTDPKLRQTFLDRIVTPFVGLGAAYHDVLYAWEVMNEPSWLNTMIGPAPEIAPWPATELDTYAFLRTALERIKQVDPTVKTTVGHRYYGDLKKYPKGDIPQFHFYPSRIGPLMGELDELPDLRELRSFESKPILGEIGTNTEHGGPWSELNGRDWGNPRERVYERLQAANRKGYEVVLLWPECAWDEITEDSEGKKVDHLKFSAEAQQGIKDFTGYPMGDHWCPPLEAPKAS